MRSIVFSVLFFCTISTCIFSQSKEIIQVETNDLSMIFTASKNEKVTFQYWGDKISDTSAFGKIGFKKQPDSNEDSNSQIYPA